MTATNLIDCTVYLDANFDLYQAGNPHKAEYIAGHCDDGASDDAAHEEYVQDFADAYEVAANKLGELLSVNIGIEPPACSQYGGLPGGNVESEAWAQECDLWQGLHSCVVWSAESATWQADAAKVKALAARIR